MGTKFSSVYNRLLEKITDDLYVELTPQDTLRDLQHLLIDAISGFEFPRKNLYDYELSTAEVDNSSLTGSSFIIEPLEDNRSLVDNSSFANDLTEEEMNILALLMMNGWLQRQVTSIENTRQKYSGTDFKLTSQANHLSKLLSLQTETQRQAFHMQRLYKRRRYTDDGSYEPNWSILRDTNSIDY